MKSLLNTLTIGVLLFSGVVFADEAAKAAKKPELPKSGVLSSTSKGGYGNSSVGSQWGDAYGRGGEGGAPIQGSVSRISPREWVMSLINASKEPYSVNVKVMQYGARGETVKSDSFSYSLKAGEKTERRVPAAPVSSNAELQLLNWKSLKPAAAANK